MKVNAPVHERGQRSLIRLPAFDRKSRCTQNQGKPKPLLVCAQDLLFESALPRLPVRHQIGISDCVLISSLVKRMRQMYRGAHLIPKQPSRCLNPHLPTLHRRCPSIPLGGLSLNNGTLRLLLASQLSRALVSSHISSRQLSRCLIPFPPFSCFPRGLNSCLRKLRPCLKRRKNSWSTSMQLPHRHKPHPPA
jgi:hypothetical protein